MKKILIILTAVLVIFTNCALFQPAAEPEPMGDMSALEELDVVIRKASDYLNSNIPRGGRIAILNIQSASTALSEYIIEELIANAVNDRILTVVDRVQLELISSERNFQLSGEVDERDAIEIGRIYSVQYIVSGAVSDLGDRYRIRIKALNVQTAQVQGQFNRNIAPSALITALMRTSVPASPAVPPSPVHPSPAVTPPVTPSAPAVTVVPAAPSGARNGVYTFYPRFRSMQAGLPVNNVFVPQITVTRDYIVIHFCRSATGEWENGISGFYDRRNFTLQDLDNPSRFYSPVSARSTNNGMGTIWSISFDRFTAVRFSLSCKPYGSTNPAIIFEEIILGEPNE